MRVIIPKDTAAKDKRVEFSRHNVPATFQLDGTLAGAEEITFDLIGINGTDSIPWVDEDEDEIKFTADQTKPIAVYSPIDVLVTKGVTAATAGVKLIGLS